MNKLILLHILLGCVLTGCSGASLPMSSSMVNTNNLMEQVVQGAIVQGTNVGPETVEQLRRKGLAGLLNISVKGSKEYQGPMLCTTQLEHPLTLMWHTVQRFVAHLTETEGSDSLIATTLADNPEVQFRVGLEMKLPSGTRYGTEIVSGGMLLRILQQAKENETLILSICFYDANAFDKETKESYYSIVTKENVFDDFVNKIVIKQKIYTLPRKSSEILWLRLKHGGVDVLTASSLQEMNAKEKPDFSLYNIVSIEIKRVDPKDKEGKE